MSATVKLAGKMPGGVQINGVDAQASDLVKDPEQLRCAVVWYDVQSVLNDVEHSTIIPKIQVLRIEPIGPASGVPKAVKDAVSSAVKARTGRAAIPFEIVEVHEGDDQDQLAIGDES